MLIMMKLEINLLKIFSEFENKETGETIEIKAKQSQMADCKDWNDVLVEKHYNDKEKEHEQEASVIVQEKMNMQLSYKVIKRQQKKRKNL